MKKNLFLAFIFLGIFSVSSQNQTSIATAALGEALHFDGVDDNVQITHFARPAYLTIEAWVKTTNTVTDMMIVGWSGTATTTSFEFYISMGSLGYAEWDGVTFPGVYAPLPMDNNWHHVAVTRTGNGANNVTLYLDGNVLSNGTATHSVNTNDLRIGAYNYLNSIGRLFEGSIDEVRIWNRALCIAEIQNNKNCELAAGQNGLLVYHKFNNGTGGGNNAGINTSADASGNNNNGVLNNFALNGGTSNWESPGAVSAGSVCSLFNPGPTLTLTSSSPTICAGSTATLFVSGALSYIWSTGSTIANTTVTPGVTTVYTVTGTYSNNCNRQATITQSVVICAGLNEQTTLENTLQVFPNPNNGQFNIYSSIDSEVEIINELGQVIRIIILNDANKKQFATSDLPAGIYFLRNKNAYLKVQKIIVSD